MPTQAERSEATRARLIRAARGRFIAQGYQATLLDSILRDAGLSKGALYHHFESKEAVFAAVFEEIAIEAVAQARAAEQASDSPLTALIRVSMAWLEAVTTPPARVIILETAPLVMGWQKTRQIQERTAIGLVRANLRAAIAAGEAHCADVHTAARLISVSLSELALLRHEAARNAPSLAELHVLVNNLILHLSGARPQETRVHLPAGAAA